MSDEQDTKAARAYRRSIQRSIIEILSRTANEYREFGDPRSDLRHAPEYYINVNLAQGLTREYPALRFRLEHHASAFDESARSAIDSSHAIGKATARFDIVLLNRVNNVPRYIIEVKRGPRVLADARRILSMAAQESDRPRWRHGFLVVLLRRTEDVAKELVAKIVSDIEAGRQTVRAQLPSNRGVRVRYEFARVGEAVNQESGKTESKVAVFAAVFLVSLVNRATMDADSVRPAGDDD